MSDEEADEEVCVSDGDYYSDEHEDEVGRYEPPSEVDIAEIDTFIDAMQVPARTDCPVEGAASPQAPQGGVSRQPAQKKA